MNKHIRITLASAAAGFWPLLAEAHNFKTGTAYPQIVEGAGATLNDPVALLTLIPIGLMCVLWRQEDGLPRIWLALLAGMIVGVFAAPFGSPAIAVPSLALGLLCAGLAILMWNYPQPLVWGLAFLSGLLAIMSTLEGHVLAELPIPIIIGILIGANIAVVVAAGIVKIVLDRVHYSWNRLAMRILSSWTAAVTVMLLAFHIVKMPVG